MSNSTRYVPLAYIHQKTQRGSISRDVRARIWDVTRGQCWYCGSSTNPYVDFCIDHLIPLARGGEDEIENFVPSCSYCNQRKAASLLDEWRRNFAYAEQLDEHPWIHPSGLFFFEREPMWEHMRQLEIRAYRRWNPKEAR